MPARMAESGLSNGDKSTFKKLPVALDQGFFSQREGK